MYIEIVSSEQGIDLFKTYIQTYHYLGYSRVIGENMKYMVRSKDGSFLACLLFGAAAWACRDRDTYIGWDREQRVARLNMLANNVRFLIAPWVRVSCLASYILARISHRISTDWEAKYGHPLQMLETFVDERFQAVCYRAANWTCVGRTAGRGRNDRLNEWKLSEKGIYLLPLNRKWKKSLLAGQE